MIPKKVQVSSSIAVIMLNKNSKARDCVKAMLQNHKQDFSLELISSYLVVMYNLKVKRSLNLEFAPYNIKIVVVDQCRELPQNKSYTLQVQLVRDNRRVLTFPQKVYHVNIYGTLSGSK